MSDFAELFGFPAEAAAQAPGRVNLLGEHTDYNDGFVLPTAIPQSTSVKLARSRDECFRFHSSTLETADEPALVRYLDGERVRTGYGTYVQGCIEVLRERSFTVPPITLSISSTVPMGSGLSSSAALEVAVLRGLRALLDLPIDDLQIALLAQCAEIQYAGVRCGIMDQMASSLADREHMLFLDTRSLERRLLPFPEGTALVVIDSGVPRSLAESGYNARRTECETAARLLNVKALRDVASPDIAESLPDPLNRRARHVISENLRVLKAASGVDAATLGELINASHASLRDDYEVSIKALDDLVECLQRHPDVYGARLTGAGFGGATVALVKTGANDRVHRDVLDAYSARGHRGRVLV